MSTIEENLRKILAAVYGEEVRGAIHDSIAQCYSDTSEGKTLAETAAEEATEAAGDASDAAVEANAAAVAARVYSDAYQDVSDNQIIVETESAAIAHVEDAARAKLKELKVKIDAVQAGSGDPSPTNIRPISGWTSVNVVRTGKNIATGIDKVTLPVSTQTVLDFGRDVTIDLTISLICNGVTYTNATGSLFDLRKADGTHNYRLPGHFSMSPNTANTGTYTTTATGVTLRRVVLQNNCNMTGGTLSVQIELGSTATDYEPYSGVSAPYTLPTEAGTVYGGKLTVNEDGSGTLVVDKFLETMNGTESWDLFNSSSLRYTFRHLLNNKKKATVTTISDMLSNSIPLSTSSESYADYSGVITCRSTTYESTYFYVFAPPDLISTVEELKAYLSQTPLQIVAPLAAPVTYILTAQQVLSLVKGVNNVYADTGDTAIKYVTDTKTYIDNKFAELQALVLENTGESGPGAVDVVLDTQSYIVSCTSEGKIRETFTKVFKFEGQVGGERAACTLVSVTSSQIDKGLTVAKQSDGTVSSPGYLSVSGTAGQFPFTDSVLHDYCSSGTWTLEFSVNGKQIFKTFNVTAVFAGT